MLTTTWVTQDEGKVVVMPGRRYYRITKVNSAFDAEIVPLTDWQRRRYRVGSRLRRVLWGLRWRGRRARIWFEDGVLRRTP